MPAEDPAEVDQPGLDQSGPMAPPADSAPHAAPSDEAGADQAGEPSDDGQRVESGGAARPRRTRARPHAASSPLNFDVERLDWRAWFTTARDGVRGLLARPLTSFHLVVSLALLLTIIGLIMVQSASSVEGYAQDHSSYGAFTTQALFAVLGWGAFYGALRLPIRLFRRVSTPAIWGSVALLVLVLVPYLGVKVDGARRWFDVAGVSIQPSELAKVALCLWGANVLATRRSVGLWGKELILPLLPVALLICGLIIAEPNLSTTVVMVIITGSLLWFAGLRPSVFAGLAGFFVFAAVVAALSADYRAARVFSFFGGNEDSLDAGYQAMQAKYALANGGVFGVGLGQSTAKWNYLPNAHNDFIFAILVEETGLIGGMIVIGLFLMLAYVGMRIARRSADPFLRLLTATITVLFTAQMFINVGYVVGLLPVTGIQLPLLSQGGTSMLVMLFLLGLMASAARHEPDAVIALSGSRSRGLSQILRLPAPAPYRPRTATSARAHADRRRPTGHDRLAPPSRAGRGEPKRAPRPTARREADRATAREPRRGVDRVPTPPPSRRAPAPGVAGASASRSRQPRTHTERSDEIHYARRQANSATPRRSAARSRATESPRGTEYRRR